MSAAQGDARAVVYLLHGVDTDLEEGEPYWYRHVAPILQPFFQCVPLRYTGYDKGGKRRVATWGGGFAIALGSFSALFVIGWSGMPGLGSTLVATLALAGVTLSVLERARRARTVREVGSRCSVVHETAAVPAHVIAHSFGTYLFERILREAGLRLRHVILVGSVLSRATNWGKLWNLRHDAVKPFVCIRNEYSFKDNVAGWAGYAWLLTGCGSAGKHGFMKRGSTVAYHELDTPYGPCATGSPECAGGPVVHNVKLEPFTHSSVFLSGDHAKRLWLPVLFDIPPAEYALFMNDCMRVVQKQDDPGLLGSRADILGAKPWTFLGTSDAPVSINDYVRARLPALVKGNATRYMREVCVTTAQYFMAGWKASGEKASRAHLLPAHAVNSAMKRALAQA